MAYKTIGPCKLTFGGKTVEVFNVTMMDEPRPCPRCRLAPDEITVTIAYDSFTLYPCPAVVQLIAASLPWLSLKDPVRC